MYESVPSSALAFSSCSLRTRDHGLEVNLLQSHDNKTYHYYPYRFLHNSNPLIARGPIKLSQTHLHCERCRLAASMSHPLQVSATAGKADFSRPVNDSALKGKSVLVTGGASGLGAAFVRGFAEAGYIRPTWAPGCDHSLPSTGDKRC